MTIETKINGKTYRFSQLAAREALALLADLGRIGGPALGRLPQIIVALNTDDEGKHALADIAALQMIVDTLRVVETPDLMEMIQRLLKSVEIQQASGTYTALEMDRDFHANLKSFVPIINRAIMVQYADFFPASAGSGILGMLKAVLAKAK